MKFAKFALPILSVVLCACSNSGAATTKAAQPNPTLRDVTDQSACKGDTPPNMTVYGAWKKQLASDQIAINMVLQIHPTSVTLTNTCLYNGVAVDVSVDAPIEITGNRITILQDVENKNEVQQGGGTYDCSASIKADSADFGFAGRCLAINHGGNVDYMVP